MAVLGLIRKGIVNLLACGLVDTLNKARGYARAKQISRQNLHARILSGGSPKDRFTAIYNNNLWGSKESASGPGSDLSYTANLRESLPAIFEKYSIRTILDTPCGDFNWMKVVLKDHPDLRYFGGDIVEELINRNNALFSGTQISFGVIDITKDTLPDADLMIVRDCLFHLSYADINSFLGNLSRSNIKYLLTTTHTFDQPHRNTDIVTGDFRFIDIFSEPFCFPMPPLERIDDWLPPDRRRQMCLFKTSSLPGRIDGPS